MYVFSRVRFDDSCGTLSATFHSKVSTEDMRRLLIGSMVAADRIVNNDPKVFLLDRSHRLEAFIELYVAEGARIGPKTYPGSWNCPKRQGFDQQN